MTDTNHNKITSLIEHRIRTQVEAEAAPAIVEFEQAVEAAIKKLHVHVMMVPVRPLVEYVRAKHIDNAVHKRVKQLVERLVQDEQAPAPAQAEPGNAQGTLPSVPPSPAPFPPGATLIIECAQALTTEQRAEAEARALAKLPAGCQVLVLDRGLTVAGVAQAHRKPVIPQPTSGRSA